MSESVCAHDVVFGRLCAICGEDLDALASREERQEKFTRASIIRDASAACNPTKAKVDLQRPGLLTTSTSLKVSSRSLKEFEQTERNRRIQMKRLALVLDIDHTLVQVCPKSQIGPCERIESIIELPSVCGHTMYLKLRPHLCDFLCQARGIAELYLYTQGVEQYAHAVVAAIDPRSEFFGMPPRIFHRNNTPQGMKDLNEIFPADTSLVVVVDDRDEVWSHEVREKHLIKILPYLHFADDSRANVSLEGTLATNAHDVEVAPGRSKKRLRCESDLSESVPTEKDVQLLRLLDILYRIHEELFGTNGHTQDVSVANVASILPRLRKFILHGCVLCFTGLGTSQVNFISRWCEFMGARVVDALRPHATHLVAARLHTKKWHEAVALQKVGVNIHIVHVGWIFRAIGTWQRPQEMLFLASSSPDQEDIRLPHYLDVW